MECSNKDNPKTQRVEEDIQFSSGRQTLLSVSIHYGGNAACIRLNMPCPLQGMVQSEHEPL
jgi:hypothetical protein